MLFIQTGINKSTKRLTNFLKLQNRELGIRLAQGYTFEYKNFS